MIEKELAKKAIVRKDKIKNTAKIIKEVLKNPLATQDELVIKTGLWKGTVNRNIQELDQNGLLSDSIDKICNNDKELIWLVSWLNIREIKKYVDKDEVSLTDLRIINDITEKSTRRYTLFKWDITNKDGWLKNIQEIDSLPLDQVIRALHTELKIKS